MTLAAARQAAQDARIAVAKGEHLTVAKRIARVHLRANASNTFATVARDWMDSEGKRAGWTDGHRCAEDRPGGAFNPTRVALSSRPMSRE